MMKDDRTYEIKKIISKPDMLKYPKAAIIREARDMKLQVDMFKKHHDCS